MDNKRILAGFIDFLITALIQSILFGLFIIKPLITDGVIIQNIFFQALKITLISMIYLIFRDILGTRSLGKMAIKLNIVDSRTGKPASFIQRLFRNFSLLLGPIDILVLLITGKRIGDSLLHTKILSTPSTED